MKNKIAAIQEKMEGNMNVILEETKKIDARQEVIEEKIEIFSVSMEENCRTCKPEDL